MVMVFRSPGTASLLVALGAALALGAAWFFQLVVGLAPCPLCLDQRVPYYVGLPLALILAFLAARGMEGTARIGLWILAALMLLNAGVATYHAGIEWHFWPGPSACSGTAPVVVSDIMSALKTAHVPRCDEAAWRLFGISMAGWNALIALTLAVVAVWGATAPKARASRPR